MVTSNLTNDGDGDGDGDGHDDERKLLQSIRQKASAILKSLEIDNDAIQMKTTTSKDEDTTQTQTQIYQSWIRGKVQVQVRKDADAEDEGQHLNHYKYTYTHTHTYPTPKCQYFDENGFLLLPSFCDGGEVDNMKDEMKKLVQEQWDPNNIGGSGTSESSQKKKQKQGISIFRTDEKQIENQGSDDYFLSSANKIHFFAESKAIDKDTNTLKSKYTDTSSSSSSSGIGNENENENKSNKMLALNKAGHGMHMAKGNPFHSYTTSEKIYNIVRELGWKGRYLYTLYAVDSRHHNLN